MENDKHPLEAPYVKLSLEYIKQENVFYKYVPFGPNEGCLISSGASGFQIYISNKNSSKPYTKIFGCYPDGKLQETIYRQPAYISVSPLVLFKTMRYIYTKFIIKN